jgi:hypothetical protein
MLEGVVRTVVLSDLDMDSLVALVQSIDRSPMSEGDAYANLADLVAALPQGVVQYLISFREQTDANAIWLKGLPLGQMAHQPTPLDGILASRQVFGFGALSFAILGLLGTLYAYKSQQGGRLLNNIAPSPAHAETADIGTGSAEPFDLHSEDAFMEYPPNYLQLSCIRNRTGTPTTLAGLQPVPLPPAVAAVLREPIFLVKTNAAQASWGDDRLGHGPVLRGFGNRLYLRFNSVNTIPAQGNEYAAEHLAILRDVFQQNMVDIALAPGDVLIVNNHRMCHARRAFKANFDGQDRWLVRLVAYRDPSLVSHLTQYTPYPTLSPDVD